MMSHSGPVTEDMEENTTDLESYLEGYFLYMTEDGTDTMLHIESEEGKVAIEDLRDLNGKSKTWKPNTLAASHALQRLLNKFRAQKVRQHGAFGKGATADLNYIIRMELTYRENAILTGKKIVTRILPENDDSSKDSNQEEAGAPSSSAPATPQKYKVNLPDRHGITYPTPEHYHSLTPKEKSRLTRSINDSRKKAKLDKWYPPSKSAVMAGFSGEESGKSQVKKRKKEDGTAAKEGADKGKGKDKDVAAEGEPQEKPGEEEEGVGKKNKGKEKSDKAGGGKDAEMAGT